MCNITCSTSRLRHIAPYVIPNQNLPNDRKYNDYWWRNLDKDFDDICIFTTKDIINDDDQVYIALWNNLYMTDRNGNVNSHIIPAGTLKSGMPQCAIEVKNGKMWFDKLCASLTDVPTTSVAFIDVFVSMRVMPK